MAAGTSACGMIVVLSRLFGRLGKTMLKQVGQPRTNHDGE
jgi:hypothetical protein